MENSMLPTTRHIKELINHAEEHINSGTESDLKFSLICADNSIEIMLKEYLRYKKGESWNKIEKKGFYDLLNSCNDVPLVKNSKDYFLAYHDIRNSVYHTGTLVPSIKDVEYALGLAKTLFNELHPKIKFVEAKIEPPCETTIQSVTHFIGLKPYFNGLSLIRELSNYFDESGYKVVLEPNVADKFRADIIAQKGNEIIVCEVKGLSRSPVGLSALFQLKEMVDYIRNNNPSADIKGWLITNTTFTNKVEKLSKEYNIKLIDGEQLNNLLK